MHNQPNTSYKSNWEAAIAEVNDYFEQNAGHAEALSAKKDQSGFNINEPSLVDIGRDAGKQHQSDGATLSMEEIQRFNERVETHLQFKAHDFTAIENKSFKDVYFSSKRTPEEDLIVKAASAALSPSEFQNAITDRNVTIGQVATQIENSNLNRVVQEMAEIDELRRKEAAKSAIEGQQQQKGGNIWDDLGHILDKITSTLANHKMDGSLSKDVRGLAVSPDPTPHGAKSGGIAPSI